jgi:hypothetical protein
MILSLKLFWSLCFIFLLGYWCFKEEEEGRWCFVWFFPAGRYWLLLYLIYLSVYIIYVSVLFLLLKCISELPSLFHQFRFLVALASAWSLTWYQSPGSWVWVPVFAIYCKIVVAPLCVHVLTFSSPVCVNVLIFSSPVCVHMLIFSSPVTREWRCWSV